MGVASDLRTKEAVAAYYPAWLRAGGYLSFPDTDYHLTIPLLRDGWWLRDENRKAIAILREEKSCASALELREECAHVGEHLTLVLLVALWATLVAPRNTAGNVGGS